MAVILVTEMSQFENSIQIILNFVNLSCEPTCLRTIAFTVGTSSQGSVSNMKDCKKKELPSFWVPSLTPSAAPKEEEKPVRPSFTSVSQ